MIRAAACRQGEGRTRAVPPGRPRGEPMTDLATNVLSYGDNLDILRRYLPDAAIDLVGLDPPFNSNREAEA
jgi:hypothetical protein